MARNENFGMRFINSRYYLPYQIKHLVIYGKTGTGKSQTLKSFAERAYMRGAKIFDLYSAGRGEGFYWSLKSNHPFWNNRKFTYKRQTLEARDFPMKGLVPVTNHLPSEIPDFCKPFTISIKDLTENDLKAMLGNTLTKNEIALWRTISEKITGSTTLIDLLNYIIDAQKSKDRIPGIHGTGISSVYNMLNTFKKHNLFTSDNNPLTLNLDSEIRNKKVITSLILEFAPSELWEFILNHIIYQINEIVIREHIKHPIILLIREVGDFLYILGESSPQQDAIRSHITQIMTKGRKNRLFFWTDNQTPLNVEVARDQFGIKVCHAVDNTVILKNALGDLGTMLLTANDYNLIRTFKPGRCFILEDGKGLFNPQMFPPLSRMSGEEGADFIEIWRNEKGERFINTKSILDVVKTEYEEANKKWEDKLVERKKKEKLEKELKEAAKEKEKEAIESRKRRKRELEEESEEEDEEEEDYIDEEETPIPIEIPLLQASNELLEPNKESITSIKEPEKEEEIDWFG